VRDLRAIAAFGERRHAPVGDRHDHDLLRIAAGEADRALQQRCELAAILLGVAAAVLIVHADEQRHEIVRTLRMRGVDRGVQLIGRPAGFRNDLRIAEAELARELHRKALGRRNALADRVRIAEGEIARCLRH
jgi:hypothetical protein